MVLKCVSLCATWQGDYTIEDNVMIGLVNDLEERNEMFHVKIMKDKFTYVNRRSTCPIEERLMVWWENSFERKKIVYFSLCEDVGVLEGELKIKDRADK